MVYVQQCSLLATFILSNLASHQHYILPNQCINILLCIYVYIYNDLYIYVYINMTFNNKSANNLQPNSYDQKRSASHFMKEYRTTATTTKDQDCRERRPPSPDPARCCCCCCLEDREVTRRVKLSSSSLMAFTSATRMSWPTDNLFRVSSILKNNRATCQAIYKVQYCKPSPDHTPNSLASKFFRLGLGHWKPR